MPSTTRAAPTAEPLRPLTLASALRRALLGIVILVVAMGGVAWLTYASIDPDLDRDISPSAIKATHSIADHPVHL